MGPEGSIAIGDRKRGLIAIAKGKMCDAIIRGEGRLEGKGKKLQAGGNVIAMIGGAIRYESSDLGSNGRSDLLRSNHNWGKIGVTHIATSDCD